MTNPDDGGPAFPVLGMPVDPDAYLNRPGISMRDYFAAAALQGLIASPKPLSTSLNPHHPNIHNDTYSKAAYLIADAMISERNKNTTKQ